MGKGFVFLGVIFLLIGFAALALWLLPDLRTNAADVFAACDGTGADCDDGLKITSIVLALTFVPTGLLFTYLGWPSRSEKAEKPVGLEGTGTILSLKNTGVGVNANPYVEFELQVELENMAPFVARTSSVVPRLVGDLGPGRTLPVRAQPMDPSRVVIDWERV